MRILAVNGSPRGAAGNTDILTRAFLRGAIESGAEAETVYLKDAKIEHCSGCFSCWARTPGVCVHQDDMSGLLEKVRWADLLVWATPLYFFGVSGLMKDFMDRQLPLAQPFMMRRNGHIVHPPRYPRETPRRSVLISNCGFPESHHFAGLRETFRVWMDVSGQPLAGAICCAGGSLLQGAESGAASWYLDAVRAAGREIATDQAISPAIQAILDRPLFADPDAYAEQLNRMWRAIGVGEIHHTTSESRPQG